MPDKKKSKISLKKKIQLVEDYINGKSCRTALAKLAGVSVSTFRNWILIYEIEGKDGLKPMKGSTYYPADLKIKAVNEYLNGTYGLVDVCKKYGIRNTKQLRNWIKIYNTHGSFKSKTGGSNMSKARKTTLKERSEMVRYCITNGRNLAETAFLYKVSYQQICNWVSRYEKMGEAGLQDRRGHSAGTLPSRTPAEITRDTIAQKDRRIKQLEMELDLSKKMRELERKWD